MAREVLADLTRLLREVFDDEDIEVSRSTVAGDIPGWDSLSNTVVILSIENHFGIQFSGKKVFSNVGDLADEIALLTK